MAMPMNLVLVRHGQGVGNVALANAKAGESTPPAFEQHSSRKWLITDAGKEQAAKSGNWLRGNTFERFDRYYCSPYVRTLQTAALLDLPEARWSLEPLLRERDRGYEYIGTRDFVANAFPDSDRSKRADAYLWRPAGGESIPDVDLRVRDMLATFARELSGADVLCVTHEDTMDAFRLRLEKLAISWWLDGDTRSVETIPNGGILHYTRRNPDDSAVESDKFGWVRLVDPAEKGGFDWREIQRPRYSNDELLAAAAAEGTGVAG